MLPLKNIAHEIQLTIKRAAIATAIIVILTLVLISRLAYLQIYKQQFYQTLSTNNFLAIVPIAPPRGLIYDRNKILLADNMPIFSLELSPFHQTRTAKFYHHNLPTILNALNKIVHLSPTDLKNITKQIKQNRAFTPITLKLRLSETELVRFTENKHLFPAVQVKAQLLRHYLFGHSLSHVIGYVGQINSKELATVARKNYADTRNIGKVGIEKYFEKTLHGTEGYQEVEVNANGQALRVLKQVNPTPGENLFLTIDLKLQLVVEQALAGQRGAAVVIQPQTGAVLAMVSLPNYDPNSLVAGLNATDFSELQQAADHPLYNRAIAGLYPLGSTIKPYLALAGLDSNTVTADDTIFDPGWFKLPNSSHVFRDMKTHGSVNLPKALITSCDVYFYYLAHKLGIKTMNSTLAAFGFGAKTGLESAEEAAGVLASPAWKMRHKNLPWYPGDTIITGIGQGYLQATPLQMAVAVATLANRGYHMSPTLLLQPLTNQAEQPQLAGKLINLIELADAQYWEEVITAMQQVIDSPMGTAHRFGPHPNYSIAVKTGTAQVHRKPTNLKGLENQELLAENLRDHATFIAFAPSDKPQIAVAIVVENNRSAAVPIARKIFDYYFHQASNVHDQ